MSDIDLAALDELEDVPRDAQVSKTIREILRTDRGQEKADTLILAVEGWLAGVASRSVVQVALRDLWKVGHS